MIDLPSQVAAYVDAANHQDTAAIAASFTPDGTVRDEGAVHRGTAAIAAWAREVAQRYRFTIEPRSATQADGRYRLHATVHGNFPGSPTAMAFAFVLEPGGIGALEIAA
ncbi:nuclear transport factor 2 family protein [Pseudoduganella plicata]|nr:nuclear transport factor 2 family protein [Pseudoduganella plicata]GGY97418.1 hypothetical protein GCM10007388_33890 [Pseudoduganella plicata]